MTRALMLLVALLLPLRAADGFLTFSPLGGGRQAALWAVSGCGVKAMGVARLYAIAAAHGIAWMPPEVAAERLSRRTLWGKVARWTGFAAAGVEVLLATDVVAARSAVKTGMTLGSLFLGVAAPFAVGNVPRPMAQAGRGLAVDETGCGQAYFYALPSKLGAFTEQVTE